jgi:uncharacterized protein
VQRHEDGTLVVSATDLVGFLECDHLVTLEELRARGELERPYREDPELDLIRQRGYDHERRYIDRLEADGRTVTEMQLRDPGSPADLAASEAETLAAMEAGADVIFQATLFDGRWRGHPDFLVRRDDRPSALGGWSYEVADTKLAKRVRAAAILQMCVYADLLERLQGIPPETVSVVTGDREAHEHRLDDYAAYYRAAKRRFEERVFGATQASPPPTYPEPVEHCRVCSWWPSCMDRRRADDHLSLVAGAARTQRRKLTGAGVTTLAALARLPEAERIAGLEPRILDRLRRQAALQLEARETGRDCYELIPPNPDDPGKGLAALPPPSELDVFFDIEADPWALDDGLEYLFGWAVRDPVTGEPAYHLLWAHDRAQEKAMLEAFVDLVLERRARDPGMHVYHYGGYESGALKRLMQRHATREDEIDVLLRGHVLVNLYDHVVRGAVRAGIESYSIKQLERFYMPQREGGITRAGFSVVEYERWMESGDPAILDALAAYNRDDCISNLLLRDWLEDRRVEALETHPDWYPDGEIPRPSWEDGAPSDQLRRDQEETRAREDALRGSVPADREQRTPEQQGRWLLAALLDWHRREAKPQWWLWYELARAPMEDLVASPEALGDLAFVDVVGRSGRSVIQRYRFDPAQDTKLHEGDKPIDPATGGGAGEVVGFDPLAGTIDLRHGPATPHPAALIPGKPYGPEPMRGALGRLADHVIEHGIEGPGRFRSARDLVLRVPPRIAGLPTGERLARDGEGGSNAGRRLVLELDASVLPIQGPPGTGKTWTAARMILDLVRLGRRVGVTAQSHRVIANLLEAIADANRREGGPLVRIAQKCEDGDGGSDDERVERVRDNGAVLGGLRDGTWDVVGGTAWLWAREDMEASVDVLFVDEAGQFSLATACAVAGAAASMVLLGDPNQLPQVSQGTHPEGAAASALEHLVGDGRTITPERGLLLETTYRLHPDVNAFISDAFYEGRLLTAPGLERQRVADGPPLGDGPAVGGTGIRHVALAHQGARNRSHDEADWVAEAIASLVGRTWRDHEGQERPLNVEDVLVVAPYNAQVAEVARTGELRLGARPNVGTVDKFQGREAPVAIYSMTTSTPEDAPRDLEFLYSGNRLNVAVSRARGLAIVLASPELLRVACRTPEQMRLVNALCRLVEVAASQQERLPPAARPVQPPPPEGPTATPAVLFPEL